MLQIKVEDSQKAVLLALLPRNYIEATFQNLALSCFQQTSGKYVWSVGKTSSSAVLYLPGHIHKTVSSNAPYRQF